MYIAMNRFKVVIGLEGEFEEVWRGRDSRLSEVPGFLEFRLLRGKSSVEEGYTLFSSHTTWHSEDDFDVMLVQPRAKCAARPEKQNENQARNHRRNRERQVN